MKQYETRTQPAQPEMTYQVEMAIVCDLCGRQTEANGKWRLEEWGDTINETEISVKVRRKRGYAYADGGSGTEVEIDLCPTCFKDRLIPWLVGQGAKVEEKEWDW